MADARRISAALAQRLRSDWHSRARPERLPPDSPWSICLMLAGRGWGNTRAGAEWVRGLAEWGVSRIALVGATAADVRDIMIEGESGILACCPADNRPLCRVTWLNGAIATAYSTEESDRLRGPQHAAAWCDELASWRNAQETFDQLSFGLRLGRNPQTLITATPRPITIIRKLVKRAAEGKDVIVIKGNTLDNADNLAPAFLSTIIARYEGTRLARQELNAEILEDVEGALWSWEMLEACRVDHAPEMRRIVVAIDPAVSVSETSDATGIIVAGLGVDGHGYVLQDLSGKMNPIMWANRAIAAYKRHKADRIVAESNQGGQMVETTLRAVDRNVPCR